MAQPLPGHLIEDSVQLGFIVRFTEKLDIDAAYAGFLVTDEIYRSMGALIKIASSLQRSAYAALFCVSLLASGCGAYCRAQSVPSTAVPMPVNVINIPINAPIPSITIDAGDEQITGINPSFSTLGQFNFTGGVSVVGGTEFALRSDSISGNLKSGVATAVGHVFFRELNSYLQVDSLFASRDMTSGVNHDEESWSGSAQNVVVRSSPYTISAERLEFQTSEVDLYSATLTTCPPDEKSDYSIRASKISFQPLLHRITIYNGSFYLGRTRLFEFRKLTRRTGTFAGGAAGGDKLFNESFGYTGYSGPFVSYSSHLGLKANVVGTLTVPEKHGVGLLLIGKLPLITPRSKTVKDVPRSVIGRIRQAVEANEPILPEGDPLLFHWFQTTTAMEDRFLTIPNTLSVNATGVASYREQVFGHDTDNLFYSRIPEASLTAIAPVSGPRNLPTSRDPTQLRSALRQIALYAVVTPTVGRYHEYPDGISSNRESGRLDLQSRPILIGDNMLFKPTLSYLDSTYPEKHESFRIFQYDLALERYYTDETGYGAEFIESQEHGSSPFQFDTPFTSRELDGRFQIGMPHVILGAILKYDLNGNSFFEEEIMIAPVLRGLIPRFTYDFRDSTFAVGVDIKGLTY